MRYVFDVDQNGNGTVTIGDNGPMKVVALTVELNRPVFAIDPDEPSPDRFVTLEPGGEGDIKLSATLIFPPVNKPKI